MVAIPTVIPNGVSRELTVADHVLFAGLAKAGVTMWRRWLGTPGHTWGWRPAVTDTRGWLGFSPAGPGREQETLAGVGQWRGAVAAIGWRVMFRNMET